MSVTAKEMIYLKNNRIYFTPYLKEYDITDHIQELIEQLENLKEKIKNELQLENVEINNFVDESLLGGLKLTYNNKVVDATIKAKLNAIKSKISSI